MKASTAGPRDYYAELVRLQIRYCAAYVYKTGGALLATTSHCSS